MDRRLTPRTGRDWPSRDPAWRTDWARLERTGDRTPPSCSSTSTFWPIVALLSSAARFPADRDSYSQITEFDLTISMFSFNLNDFSSCTGEQRQQTFSHGLISVSDSQINKMRCVDLEKCKMKKTNSTRWMVTSEMGLKTALILSNSGKIQANFCYFKSNKN